LGCGEEAASGSRDGAERERCVLVFLFSNSLSCLLALLCFVLLFCPLFLCRFVDEEECFPCALVTMSWIIYPALKLIHIRIPKCGSTSVRHVLKQVPARSQEESEEQAELDTLMNDFLSQGHSWPHYSVRDFEDFIEFVDSKNYFSRPHALDLKSYRYMIPWRPSIGRLISEFNFEYCWTRDVLQNGDSIEDDRFFDPYLGWFSHNVTRKLENIAPRSDPSVAEVLPLFRDWMRHVCNDSGGWRCQVHKNSFFVDFSCGKVIEIVPIQCLDSHLRSITRKWADQIDYARQNVTATQVLTCGDLAASDVAFLCAYFANECVV